MIITKRPVYPSNKLTFFPKDFNKEKVDWINVFLKPNLQFDVEMIIEDAQRYLVQLRVTAAPDIKLNILSVILGDFFIKIKGIKLELK